MKRLFTILGVCSLIAVFWFSVGYILSLFFQWSINIAIALAGIAFILVFGAIAICSVSKTEAN